MPGTDVRLTCLIAPGDLNKTGRKMARICGFYLLLTLHFLQAFHIISVFGEADALDEVASRLLSEADSGKAGCTSSPTSQGACHEEGVRCPDGTGYGYLKCVHSHWLPMPCAPGTMFSVSTSSCSSPRDLQPVPSMDQPVEVEQQKQDDTEQQVSQRVVPPYGQSHLVGYMDFPPAGHPPAYHQAGPLPYPPGQQPPYPAAGAPPYPVAGPPPYPLGQPPYPMEATSYQPAQPLYPPVAQPPYVQPHPQPQPPTNVRPAEASQDGHITEHSAKMICSTGAYRAVEKSSKYYEQCVSSGTDSSQWMRRLCPPGMVADTNPVELPCRFPLDFIAPKKKEKDNYSANEVLPESKQNFYSLSQQTALKESASAPEYPSKVSSYTNFDQKPQEAVKPAKAQFRKPTYIYSSKTPTPEVRRSPERVNIHTSWPSSSQNVANPPPARHYNMQPHFNMNPPPSYQQQPANQPVYNAEQPRYNPEQSRSNSKPSYNVDIPSYPVNQSPQDLDQRQYINIEGPEYGVDPNDYNVDQHKYNADQTGYNVDQNRYNVNQQNYNVDQSQAGRQGRVMTDTDIDSFVDSMRGRVNSNRESETQRPAVLFVTQAATNPPTEPTTQQVTVTTEATTAVTIRREVPNKPQPRMTPAPEVTPTTPVSNVVKSPPAIRPREGSMNKPINRVPAPQMPNYLQNEDFMKILKDLAAKYVDNKPGDNNKDKQDDKPTSASFTIRGNDEMKGPVDDDTRGDSDMVVDGDEGRQAAKPDQAPDTAVNGVQASRDSGVILDLQNGRYELPFVVDMDDVVMWPQDVAAGGVKTEDDMANNDKPFHLLKLHNSAVSRNAAAAAAAGLPA